jgi:asparagine synthase (glutamine-hydrolysing)
MCGILGWIDHNKDIKHHTTVISEMLGTLALRGPDDSGIQIYDHALLGHRRLTVVDPEGGKQPMTKKIGQKEYTLVYNGELYNTEDVRKELIDKGYAFNSYSDTEVLLVSYIEWGKRCVEKINGIYAFAIWDNIDQSVFLARDPLGVKPLFYSRKEGALVFGSEIKALLKHPSIEPVIDEEGLLEIFSLGPARTPGKAIFRDIEEVPPGHYLFYTKEHLHLVEYWKLEAYEHEESVEDTILHTRSLLVDAIERQLVADVSLGTFLSGGLDSSAISVIAANYFKKHNRGILNTYSIDYEDNAKYFKKSRFQPNSDSAWVDKMSDFIGSHHTKVILNNQDLVDALHAAVLANDLPGMADIDSSLLLFCQQVRNSETVALSGECADEIFGGYPWYTREADFKVNTFPWAQSLEIRKQLIGDKNLPIEEYVQQRYFESTEAAPKLKGESEEDAKMREMFYLNIKWFMLTLLNRKDRMSMANSLEVRVPFADHRIVEYAYNIPKQLKLLDGREKGLLRTALKGILPDEIIERKKSPYPKTHHPVYTEAVQNEMTQILHDSRSPIRDLIDVKEVKRFVDSKGKSITEPWYGQLMTGPQVMAYFIQINTWLKAYKVQIK